MSEAKEKYYKMREYNPIDNPIVDYVSELEQENERLKVFNQFEIDLSLEIIELKHQKAELIEFVKAMRVLGRLNPDRLSEYSDEIYHTSNELLNKLQKENK